MNVNKKPSDQVQIEKNLAGPLFMLAAALLFTLLGLLIKTLGPRYSAWDIGFYRCVGGLVVLLALFGRHKNPYKGNNVPLLVLRGITGSVAFICVVTAIRLLPLSTALVIFYCFPAFAAVFSYIIYGERLGKLGIVCISAVIIGVGVLLDFQLSANLFGQGAALVAGLFAGLTVTLIRSLRAQNGPVVIYLYFCTMGAVVTLPGFISDPAIPVSAAEWAMVLGVIFFSVTAQLFMNQGFFYCKGWEGGVLMSSEVVFTAIVGILFLGDPTGWRFWTGGCIIFGSVVALNRLKTGSPPEKPAILAERKGVSS